jgi:hypothetical protein
MFSTIDVIEVNFLVVDVLELDILGVRTQICKVYPKFITIRLGYVLNINLGLKRFLKNVRFNWKFVITKFVITKCHYSTAAP